MAIAMLGTATSAPAAGPVELGAGSFHVIAHCEGGTDADFASDVLTFNESASGGCGTAQQDSEFFDSPGGVSYSGTESVTGHDFRNNRSELQRAITVTEPVEWSATGSLAATRVHGDVGPNSAGAAFVITGDDGFEEFSAAGCDSGGLHGEACSDSAPISHSGTLAPGEYTLRVEAACTGFSGTCSADLQLELEIGDPGGGDADGDGLRDSWEQDGVDVDADGAPDLDLPSMGADPEHKDIFVEVDHMPGHRLSDAEIERVTQAFAQAPVGNPDGQPGITLHVDNGPGSVMNPPTGATWGAFSDQESLAHQEVLGSEFGDDEYDWSQFESIRQTRFAAARRPVFHYAIAAHSGPGADMAGIAQGIPSGDFLVFGHENCPGHPAPPAAECTPDPDYLAATFMHELGHTLGLRHGGTDNENSKPNYLSVMNYSFGYGLHRFTGAGNATQHELDFSRFAIPLDERGLDEQRGLGISGPASAYETLYTCQTDGSERAIVVDDTTPVDWTCNGTIAPFITTGDITGDGDRTALAGAIDWNRLVFDGGAVGDLAEPPAPDTTPIDEPTPVELEASQDALEAGPVDDSGLPLEPEPGGASPAPAPAAGTGEEPEPSAAPDDRTAPEFSGRAFADPRRFAVDRKGDAEAPAHRGRGRAPKGTSFRFTLSEPAEVSYELERKAKEGKRFVPAGSFAADGDAGENEKPFSGLIGKRKLKPGPYGAVLVATDESGNASAEKRIRFKVVRP